MRKLLYLAIAAGLVYVVVYKVPAETKRQTLAAVGLADFFSQTLPGYLRSKLTIPENPVAKRQKLLDQLSDTIGTIERELEAVLPPRTDGITLPKLPPAKEIRERIGKSREFLAQSEDFLKELERANPGEGVIRKAAERLLDKILPPAEPAGQAAIGGDAGGAECRLTP